MTKVLTIILDGWGLYHKYPGNAIENASLPTYRSLLKEFGSAQLSVSGEAVGLPEGQMGTSEVNHFTLGAGQVIFQDLVRINKAIADGSFFQNPAFLAAVEHVQSHHSALHLWGLLSDGGVHSHIRHLEALVEMSKRHRLPKVYLHLFTDGRDTSPHSSLKYLADLEAVIRPSKTIKIKSLIGRYFAMDRDHNQDRTQKAFDLIFKAQGFQAKNPFDAVNHFYAQDITDEFMEPIWLGDPKQGVVKDNDAVIFANFRNDRPRQLTQALLDSPLKTIKLVTMTEYDPAYHCQVAFPLHSVAQTLGGAISNAGLSQLRLTETEKFAHMTFFLNCKREEPYEREDRFMLDSYSDIKTHDQRPQMRAPDIAAHLVNDLELGTHQAIFTNICNADMVGHTGNIPAAIKACQAVDHALSLILPIALKNKYQVIITSDHGNAETMINETTGEMVTSHSQNPVPLIIASGSKAPLNRKVGTLPDVTATILKSLSLNIPQSMTGESFL